MLTLCGQFATFIFKMSRGQNKCKQRQPEYSVNTELPKLLATFATTVPEAAIEAQMAMQSGDCDWMLVAYQSLKKAIGEITVAFLLKSSIPSMPELSM